MKHLCWRYAAFLLLASLFAPVRAGEPGALTPTSPPPRLADAFDPGAARRPKVGEWLDYLVAFPADPLEHSLAPAPTPTPTPAPGADADAADVNQPSPYLAAFDPPPIWRSIVLRLEFLQVGEDACQVAMTLAGTVRQLTLPLGKNRAAADFRYDAPKSGDGKFMHQMLAERREVDLTRRQGGHYGFIRLSHPDLPFGLARFASENLDLILIAMGEGPPPALPTAATATAQPPPGFLYGGEGGKEAR